jgi:hypothetical protein
MSQSTDYVLSNQSGANFRAELNSILAAIVSQNSGSTAPTTTYAYQLWIDTSTSPALLKLRNGANNGFITIGDVTAANLGLAALASPTFTGTPAGPTASVDTGTTQLATTAYVLAQAASATPVVNGTAAVGSSTRFARADHVHGTDTTRAPLASPTFTGTVTIPAGASITGFAALATAQSFTAQQRGSISALTDGATITPDFALANNFSVTLGGNRTLANPTNLTAGASGCIWITQDGTGSRTLAYGSQWDFTGGTAPTLTTTAAATDCLVYSVQSSSRITATLITNLS